MSVEPQISGRSAVAVFIGATIFVLVLGSAFFSTLFTFEHGDDGALRGFIAIVMMSPILWFVMLIYFTVLTLCKAYKLKHGLTTGSVISAFISVLVFYSIYEVEYWFNMLMASLLICFLLIIAFGLSTLGWLRCLKPHITND
ncbi:hypothetical protein ISG33_14320 [Glaciecola sp. MH2013]|uniref:hypothetical protein n=1 Tax=Glaciecola sp. MH2013 TaxID=2785524 RepID=UPI00189DDB0A|nr:hypothetical protein [Glaciecola sp. MH2013]MBF7074577.1 hypothetical protein [Glaciecola sp. MH2013]